ncbi:pre-rRNA-processing protein esf1 [Zalaria obscura]|uniref:Pre-rRNA-processing protein esf1 n=1 Tax=Zalaria obscura TaxID=2024903 RepID=A0ACC3SPK5_9PEZI
MAPNPKAKAGRRTDSNTATSDPRFASITTDPRFRLPSSKNARVAVDKRFTRMFKDDDFSKKASVDRYGRKIKKDDAKKDLQRLYKVEDEDEDEDDSDEEEELRIQKGKDSKKSKKQIEIASASESEDFEDEDGDVEAELKRLDGKRDYAREGGFSSSDDSSSEDEDEEEEEDAELPDEDQAEAVPMGEVSSRLAVVNLDWDNIRAMDLLAVASSFAPSSGRISKVTVYPSEFGRERMEREELEGPPREIFAKSKAEERSESEDSADEDERIKKQLLKGDEGNEFDSAALRKYQLDRLKYYYAVIECDNETTAKALYDSMDGREYLTTANFFDLRFIPDEVTFDDDRPRDDCAQLPSGYKPNEFVTDALTHSKVKLTWDNDDTTRKEVQKRAFSRAEIDDNDLQAYIGSDSSDDEEDDKQSKAEAQRQKMRAALGLSVEPGKAKSSRKDDAPVGDMQVTFSSGLSGAAKGNGVFENDPATANETTKEKYIRKEKERKARRKEKAKAARTGEAGEDAEAEEAERVEQPDGGAEAEDDPFNDPFFTDAPAAQKAEKAARKAEKQKKREERQAQAEAAAAQRAELELLMVDDQESNMRHFDMNEIRKAEKQKNRKGKKGSKAGVADAEQGQDFVMETQDPRFARLFDSHEYAIDPTNPRFKATSGMKALLEEGRKKRKAPTEDDLPAEDNKSSRSGKKLKGAKMENDDGGDGGEDIQRLLAKVKAKSKAKA